MNEQFSRITAKYKNNLPVLQRRSFRSKVQKITNNCFMFRKKILTIHNSQTAQTARTLYILRIIHTMRKLKSWIL